MVIVGLHTIQSAEPCVVIGELRVLGDVGENAKDKLVWEFEDYKNGMG